MTLNQDTFDLLREKYRVYDIETRYESFDSFGASDREVTMRVSLILQNILSLSLNLRF